MMSSHPFAEETDAMDEDNVVSLHRPDDREEDPSTEVLRGRYCPGDRSRGSDVSGLPCRAGRRRRPPAPGAQRVPPGTRDPDRDRADHGPPARVRDRSPATADTRIRFTSAILPRYLRRTRLLEELLPWLYLEGHLER